MLEDFEMWKAVRHRRYHTPLLSKGFLRFNDKESFKYLENFNITWVDTDGFKVCAKNERLLNSLVKTHRYVGKKYIKKHFGKYYLGDNDGFVNGVDPGTDVWHSDTKEGSNIAVLLYFSNMSKKTGGALQYLPC